MDLSKLSRKDLIKVIANMHDAIQDWDNGWGFSIEDSDVLIEIGKICCLRCIIDHDWTLPLLEDFK